MNEKEYNITILKKKYETHLCKTYRYILTILQCINNFADRAALVVCCCMRLTPQHGDNSCCDLDYLFIRNTMFYGALSFVSRSSPRYG